MAVHSQNIALVGGKSNTEIAVDLSPWLLKYKDGRVERLAASTFVPLSEAPGPTGVATRDVVIDPCTGVSVRLFLNVAAAATGRRLPLIIYFHGGSFCTGSAFSKLFHRYATSLSARAEALVVSVDYRLAPEHPVPAAYDDAWTALRWVSALSDPWLDDHPDPKRMFLAGESCGGNIAHNMATRAGTPDGDGIDIEGLILMQPYFWGTKRLLSEIDGSVGMFSPEKVDKLWPFVTAGAAGNDDPCVNPPAHQVVMLPCHRALVAVASKDVMRERGCRYAELLRKGERCREVHFVESQGEDHGFHLYRPGRASAVELMNNVVDFINRTTTAPIVSETELFRVARTHVHAREATNKVCRAVLGPKPPKSRFGLILGGSTAFKLGQKGPGVTTAAQLGRAMTPRAHGSHSDLSLNYSQVYLVFLKWNL